MEGMERICQSCGMAMDSPELHGTHGDGHRNGDYCIRCYRNGLFTCSSIDIAANEGISEKRLHALKRWMDDEDKASWILDRCGYITLSTIDEDGCPRPVAIDPITHDGIREIWMTTYRSSAKVRHLKADPKAGISFVREADSVTLTGTAEAITEKETLRRFWKDIFIRYFPAGPDDEGYCLIRFSASKARLWIDGVASTLSFR